MRELGHGQQSDLTADEAIAIADAATSQTEAYVDPADPMGVRIGQDVAVTPEGDGGDPTVHGSLVRLDKHQIALRHHDPRIGDVVVHFPRIGYRLDS